MTYEKIHKSIDDYIRTKIEERQIGVEILQELVSMLHPSEGLIATGRARIDAIKYVRDHASGVPKALEDARLVLVKAGVGVEDFPPKYRMDLKEARDFVYVLLMDRDGGYTKSLIQQMKEAERLEASFTEEGKGALDPAHNGPNDEHFYIEGRRVFPGDWVKTGDLSIYLADIWKASDGYFKVKYYLEGDVGGTLHRDRISDMFDLRW